MGIVYHNKAIKSRGFVDNCEMWYNHYNRVESGENVRYGGFRVLGE